MTFTRSEIISTKLAYSKTKLPETTLIGDKYPVGVTVMNNHQSPQEFGVISALFMGETLLNSTNYFVPLNASSQRSFDFEIDTKGLQPGELHLQVSMFTEEQLVDRVVSSTVLKANTHALFKTKGGLIGVNYPNVT
mmetsp:Transcript_23964/g.36731  ORF Transcript_23964/g.36731 Transcript_23964/m.36731 type:complete len:136 (+) Transcript_23964:2721-3128(+)